MHLWGKKRRNQSASPTPRSTAKKEPERKTSVQWLGALPNDCQIQVRQAGAILDTFSAEEARSRPDTMLEMQILEAYGPGRYTLAPVSGGRFLDTLAFAVGAPDAQRHTLGTRRESAELEELRDKVAKQESPIAQILANFGQIAGVLKPPDSVGQLTQLMGVIKAAGPTGMSASEYTEMQRVLAENLRPAETDGGLGEVATGLINAFMQRGGAMPGAAGPQLAGPIEPEPPADQIGYANAPEADSHASLDFGAIIWSYVTSTVDSAAQSGSAETVAAAVVQFLNAADTLQLGGHERVQEFVDDPARAFDRLASEVANLHGPLQTEARQILVGQIEAAVAQNEADEPGAPAEADG